MADGQVNAVVLEYGRGPWRFWKYVRRGVAGVLVAGVIFGGWGGGKIGYRHLVVYYCHSRCMGYTEPAGQVVVE